MMALAAEAASVPLESGSSEVTATVTVAWALV